MEQHIQTRKDFVLEFFLKILAADILQNAYVYFFSSTAFKLRGLAVQFFLLGKADFKLQLVVIVHMTQ